MKVVIVGAGIIGMTLAYEWQKKYPQDSIVIIEKESKEALHASGRNSGVLHAGFYYNPDSLKAKLTVEGNKKIKKFCEKEGIYINRSAKLVVAKDKDEVKTLFELERRSKKNGAGAYIIDEEEVKKINKNVKTYKYALYSPNTASVDPKAVCFSLKNILMKKGVKFLFNTHFENYHKSYDFLINAAGSYADKIAQSFGIAKEYTMLPFKGLYLKYDGVLDIKTQIYPVPNIKNPFLGVHWTIMSDGIAKIGPTAIPAFWRENYTMFDRFNFDELREILFYESKLFITNKWFRELFFHEVKYYKKQNLINEAMKLISKKVDRQFSLYTPGIRAQLFNKKNNSLEMDFIIKQTHNQIHILNAVSPAFTASFAFAKYVLKDR